MDCKGFIVLDTAATAALPHLAVAIQTQRIAPLIYEQTVMVNGYGIEPPSPGATAGALPLSYPLGFAGA